MLVGTDLQIVFSDLIHQWTGVTYPNWARLNWLIPFAIVSTVITWKLWIDMSLCRSSQLCLGLAVLAAGALLAADQITQATGYAHVTLIAQMCLGVALFSAMALHVRFVSHVNPNPPEPKALRENPNTQIRHEEEAFSNPAPVEEPKSRKPRRARTKKSSQKRPAMRDLENYDDLEEEVSQPRRRKRTRREGPAPDSLKGMTKKQRKQARKEFREQQRAMEKGYDV